MSILDYGMPSTRDINDEVRDFAIGKINKGFDLITTMTLVQRKFSGWDIGNSMAEQVRAEIENYYWN